MGRVLPSTWWRVGHLDAPLDFLPRELCSWEHRFDDPEHEYRTIYCAEKKVTALREVLAPLRPNLNVRAEFAQFQLDQGIAPDDLFVPAREVTPAWRGKHVLVHARLQRNGPLADLDDVGLRSELERTHAELLLRHGLEHLDISELRSKIRPVTQAISRDLYEQGAAGLLFKSGIDDERCAVLFEDRGWFEETDDPWTELSEDLPELRQICEEFRLILR